MIRLAMLGISPGNGHPYSFSAIFNGYDEDRMKRCPYPVIYEYLSKQDRRTMCIPGVRVTHIWAEERREAEDVARTVFIEHVVDHYTDVIGEVDAVVIPHDEGSLHLEMARPFLEREIPIFIDKPLADNWPDALELVRFAGKDKLLMSCSASRYAREVEEAKRALMELGDVRTMYAVSSKSWVKYGVHLIEALFALFGGNVETVQNVGREGEDVVHLLYADGRQAVLQVFEDLSPLLQITLHGTKGHWTITFGDWFYMFRRMLSLFIEMIKTEQRPIPLEETLEIIKVLVAGKRSREEDNRIVSLREFS